MSTEACDRHEIESIHSNLLADVSEEEQESLSGGFVFMYFNQREIFTDASNTTNYSGAVTPGGVLAVLRSLGILMALPIQVTISKKQPLCIATLAHRLLVFPDSWDGYLRCVFRDSDNQRSAPNVYHITFVVT